MPGEMSSLWIAVTNEDRKWVSEHFPDLIFQGGSPLILSGVLKFDALYDPEKNQVIINPGDLADSRGVRIRDSYDIEIRFETSEFSSLPQVFERGGRLKRVAQAKEEKLIDLHISSTKDNSYGVACLGLKMQEQEYLPNGFNLPDYFYNFVIPFFYEQSYYEKYNKWPWGEYSHGDLGYLEGYREGDEPETIESARECIEMLKKYGRWGEYEKLLTQSRRLKIHEHRCFCGSGRKIRKCHPKVFEGLRKLKEDIKAFGVEF